MGSGECGLWFTGAESRGVAGRTASGIKSSESQEVSQGLPSGLSTAEMIGCVGKMLRASKRSLTPTRSWSKPNREHSKEQHDHPPVHGMTGHCKNLCASNIHSHATRFCPAVLYLTSQVCELVPLTMTVRCLVCKIIILCSLTSTW